MKVLANCDWLKISSAKCTLANLLSATRLVRYAVLYLYFKGVRNKVALAYDSSSPPEAVSAANSPMNSLHEVPPIKAKSVS